MAPGICCQSGSIIPAMATPPRSSRLALPPEITPLRAKVRDSLPAGTSMGGENAKLVVDASAEPSAVDVPTVVPPAVTVRVSELKIFALLTETLTEEMDCSAASVEA